MKLYRLFSIALVLSLLLASLAPGAPAQAQPGSPPGDVTIDAVPVLTCDGTGTGGDLAADRGIVFTAGKPFTSVEARFAATAAGNYALSAVLYRASGFGTTRDIKTASANAQFSGSEAVPFQPVRFDFGSVAVTGSETFALKFAVNSGPGTVYFETFGIGNKPCPNVMETEDNLSASPVERGDPAGFKVLAPNPATLALVSTYTSTPPRIDGSLDFNEWNYSNRLPFDNGFISVVNDAMRLYVLLDVTGDTGNDGVNNDLYYLTFDTNRNGVIDPNVDLNYAPVGGSSNMRYQYYLGANTWTGLSSSTYSSRGVGFGCFFGDGSFTLTSLFPLRFSCLRHRVYEFAIDLGEIKSTAPGAAKMGVRVYSGTPNFMNELPANFTADFSKLITVTLAAPPFLTVAPVSGATVAFESKPIEVTQAVQNRDNTLPLVAGKTTVARVYTITGNVPFPETVKTYLYGSSGGTDLPGSPMATMYTAPTVINRAQLNQTANFQLPAAWNQGSVTFAAKAVDLTGHTASTAGQTLTFTPKSVPTYWVVPVNIGSAASPNVVSQSTIDSQVSYIKTVYPLSNINFVQKPWTDLGTTTVDNAISKLNDYYNATFLSWVISVIFTGRQPFTLPAQIYGVTPTGGGLSDPVWAGGAGRVARGFLGTSMEGTMAHEINHNLDRSSTGTWGRHVNPSGTGCGAQGPDANWPFTDPNIHEVGFDTRLPWSASGLTLTVIPATTPDLMSYCQSGLLSPTKWISGYRWQNLFNNFATAALAPASLSADGLVDANGNVTAAAAAAIQPVYYVTGSISRNPESGKLKPVLAQQGIPDTNIPKGDYAIDVQDTNGGVISSTPFAVQFLDDPEEPVNTVYFNFQIPQSTQVPVGKIVLRHGATVLDQIAVSAHAPGVSITKPAGGETWTGVQTVQWTGSDADSDPLTYTVLYTPDGGTTWFPVASDVKTTSLAVDTAALPGGTSAMFRVIASDGFNNGQADSATFTIGNNPPVVTITAPEAGGTVPNGSVVQLTGDASDPEGEVLPDEAFVWTEGNTVVGTGRSAAATLAPGLHTLTLSAVDSLGNTGKTTVTVFVGSKVYLPAVGK